MAEKQFALATLFCALFAPGCCARTQVSPTHHFSHRRLTMSDEENKKADVKPAQQVITLKVKDQVQFADVAVLVPSPDLAARCHCPSLKQGGRETIFKVKKHTKMKKVFTAYAQRKGLRPESLRFMLDGDRVNGEDTPQSVRGANARDYSLAYLTACCAAGA